MGWLVGWLAGSLRSFISGVATLLPIRKKPNDPRMMRGWRRDAAIDIRSPPSFIGRTDVLRRPATSSEFRPDEVTNGFGNCRQNGSNLTKWVDMNETRIKPIDRNDCCHRRIGLRKDGCGCGVAAMQCRVKRSPTTKQSAFTMKKLVMQRERFVHSSHAIPHANKGSKRVWYVISFWITFLQLVSICP